MTKRYKLKNIRIFLTEGFLVEELRRFCFDEPDFRWVYDHLADNSGKAQIIDQLLEYAERRHLIDKLLTLAKEYNDAVYEAHQPYYDIISSTISNTDDVQKFKDQTALFELHIPSREVGAESQTIAVPYITVNVKTPTSQEPVKHYKIDSKWIAGFIIAILVGVGILLAMPNIFPAVFETLQSVIIQGTTGGGTFGKIIFCLENEVNDETRSCETSRTAFYGETARIDVSWTGSNINEGTKFSRKWYWNDMLISYVEDAEWKEASESSWLYANSVEALGYPPYFPPGNYTVELYIGNRLEQRGNFIIQK